MGDKKTNKKKIYVSALIAAILGGLNVAAQASAWGPERETWTMENPADYATFNSITDNTSVGDERDFVRVAEAVTEGTSTAVNELHIKGGKDYVITIYYHNDAASIYNKVEYNYKGVAQKTRLSAAFPDTLDEGEKGEIAGLIYSVTANPEEVWDEAYLIADERVKLSYISGSAKIYNDWDLSGSEINSAELFSSDGTYLGVKVFNGLIPGCAEYSGTVVFRIHAEKVVEPTSTFTMEKEVSKDSGTTWTKDAEMKPGEEAEFKITYENTGTLAQKVTVVDTLEDGQGMEYVVDSTRIVANGTERIIKDEGGSGLFSGGIEVGEIRPGEKVEIYYKVKLGAAETFVCGKTVLYNLAGVSAKTAGDDMGVATLHDKVRIEVKREGGSCLPSELPNTGPAEIVLAGVIVAGLIVGIFYYINSRRTLKRLENEAKGEGLDKPEQM